MTIIEIVDIKVGDFYVDLGQIFVVDCRQKVKNYVESTENLTLPVPNPPPPPPPLLGNFPKLYLVINYDGFPKNLVILDIRIY